MHCHEPFYPWAYYRPYRCRCHRCPCCGHHTHSWHSCGGWTPPPPLIPPAPVYVQPQPVYVVNAPVGSAHAAVQALSG